MSNTDIVYEGEERRSHVSIRRCDYHAEHTYILNTLVKDMKDLKTDLAERRQRVNDQLDSKLSAKFAIIFLATFTLSYILGVISVNKGVQANRLLLTEVKSELKLELKELQSDLKIIKQAPQKAKP